MARTLHAATRRNDDNEGMLRFGKNVVDLPTRSFAVLMRDRLLLLSAAIRSR